MSNKKNKAVKKPSSQANSKAMKNAQSTSKVKANSKAVKNAQSTSKVEDGLSEEKAAKIIGAVIAAIMVVTIAVLTGYYFFKNQHNVDKGVNLSAYTSKIAEASVKPEGVSDTYGFNISKNGYNNPVKGVPTVGIYMDFMCPGCGNFEQLNGDNLEKMVDAGQINVEYHFMNFLDRASHDKYSTRTASAAAYIAQKSPEHLLKFVNRMMSKGIQPEENSDSTPSDADIVKYAEGVGVPKNVAEEAVKAGYADWISAVNAYTIKRPSLYNISGDYAGKSMSTPAITINGKLMDIIKSEDKGIADDDALLRSLGIAKNKVGAKDYKIGLGATGEPIPFK